MTNLTKSREKRSKEYLTLLSKWYNECTTLQQNCSIGLLTHGTEQFILPPPPPFLFSTPPIHANITHHSVPPTPLRGGVFKLPPLWKRFSAELIDFGILFFIKLTLTFIATDYFDIIDIDKYDSLISLKNNDLDVTLALELTQEILFLELIHRLIVCVYEGYFLSQSSPGMIGGATPGKLLMGLRVVCCTEVEFVSVPDNLVHVLPSTKPTILQAFFRSILKNIALIAFTVVFPLLFNRFNRAGYDLICGTIVVEDTPNSNNNLRGR